MLKITKFGGSSVANATQFKKVKDIIQSDPNRKFVVVSAPGKQTQKDNKITDLLYLMDAHKQYHVDASSVYQAIKQRFLDIQNELDLSIDLEEELDAFFDQYESLSKEEIVSRGEYFCAKLMANYLDYDFVDAKDVIFFCLDQTIDFEKTTSALSTLLSRKKGIVIPGFYGSKNNGKITTFSRGGSDITGSILACCLDADMYENFTDVSGFLMADPRIVKDPLPITHITYMELRELSYMGASVLHEEAIFPVKEKNIPIHILNTNRPMDAGTIIQEHSSYQSKHDITGIAGKKDFVSIYVYKKHMSTSIGYMRKVLSIFEAYHISIEHVPTGIDSFNVVVQKQDVEDCLYELLTRIQEQLSPDKLKVQDDLALISTVGQKMSDKPGTSGKLFGALGKEHINISMIAQSSDEINITLGVKRSDFEKTIQVIYQTFVKGSEKQ